VNAVSPSPADDEPRTTRMPGGALHTRHVARKRHVCGWDCHELIEPGTRYIRSALPPRTDVNESDHWWYQALHGSFPNECPRRHGVLVGPSAAEVDRVR
jgi:hypothetical protein